MNIAIFQSFQCHYEMIGCMIEYCIQTNIDFTVYCNMMNFKHNEWKLYYEENFNIKLNWKNIFEFNHEKYNYIVVTTDDDNFLCSNNIQYNLLPKDIHSNKIITII